MSLRQAYSTRQVPGHLGLHSEILLKENKGARTADAGGRAGEMAQRGKHLLDKPGTLSSVPTPDGRTKETNSPELFFGFHYSSAQTDRQHLHCNLKEMQTTLNIPFNFILMIGYQVVRSRRAIEGRVWVRERNCPEEEEDKETVGLVSVQDVLKSIQLA